MFRRTRLQLTRLVLSGLLAVLALPRPGFAADTDARRLSFYHTHTTQRLAVVYYEDGAYIPAALEQVNALLKDFRTGDVHDIDPGLLDILYELRVALNSGGTYEVISAYRSAATNAMLRKKSSGVAKNSQHLKGAAIDVRLTGVESTALRDAALALARGGVGFYAEAEFVHVDTGRVRRW